MPWNVRQPTYVARSTRQTVAPPSSASGPHSTVYGFASSAACCAKAAPAGTSAAARHKASAWTVFIAPRATSRQREHRQHAAELGVPRQRAVRADCAETVRRALEPRRHADAGPTADAGQHADVLLAVVRPRVDVADDSGRGLEAVELLARLRIDGFEVALERAVEH